MVWVRPGVLLVYARRLRASRALIALDLPTLERPAKASSGGPGGGRSAGRPAAARNSACEKVFIREREILIKSRLSHRERGAGMIRELALGAAAVLLAGSAVAQDKAQGLAAQVCAAGH